MVDGDSVPTVSGSFNVKYISFLPPSLFFLIFYLFEGERARAWGEGEGEADVLLSRQPDEGLDARMPAS